MQTETATTVRPRAVAKVLFLAVVAAGLLLSACGRRQGGAEGNAQGNARNAGEPVAAMTVTTTTVRADMVVQNIQATGSIHPWQEVIVSAEVGGYRVSAVLVDVGTPVKKGQVLVRLSADLLNADLDSKRAAFRSAEAAEINAAAALHRGEMVAGDGLLSEADMDKLRADHIAAQARVETAGADLRTSELRARYANVTAPDSGVVTSRSVSVGQIAQAGTEMLRMLRQNRVEWRAEVPEAQLKNIAAGQAVSVTAVDGSVLTGKVRAVAPTVQTTNRTGLVYVDITSGSARPGMFARGEIQVGNSEAILLPVASVVMQDGYSYVFVLGDKNTVERRRVMAAGVHGNDVQIAEGVQSGEVVAVKGAGFLKDGDVVQVAGQEAGATAPPQGGS